jgi:hypothetical protein
MPVTNSERFSASLLALVATKRTRSTPSSSISFAQTRQEVKVLASAVGPADRSCPLLAEPDDLQSPVDLRDIGSVDIGHSSRMEFVPQSTAATGSSATLGRHARAVRPPLGSIASVSSPSGFTRARSQGMCSEDAST